MKYVSRYDFTTLKWNLGYWLGHRFYIVSSYPDV